MVAEGCRGSQRVVTEGHRGSTYNFIDRLDPNIIDDEGLLGEDLTLEELSNALKGMKDGKAPGMDGISVAFYKKFWEEIGPLVFESINHVNRMGQFSCSQRRGVVKLLPKRDKKSTFPQKFTSNYSLANGP